MSQLLSANVLEEVKLILTVAKKEGRIAPIAQGMMDEHLSEMARISIKTQFDDLLEYLHEQIEDKASAARLEIQKSIEIARCCNGQRFRRLRERLEVEHG